MERKQQQEAASARFILFTTSGPASVVQTVAALASLGFQDGYGLWIAPASADHVKSYIWMKISHQMQLEAIVQKHPSSRLWYAVLLPKGKPSPNKVPPERMSCTSGCGIHAAHTDPHVQPGLVRQLDVAEPWNDMCFFSCENLESVGPDGMVILMDHSTADTCPDSCRIIQVEAPSLYTYLQEQFDRAFALDCLSIPTSTSSDIVLTEEMWFLSLVRGNTHKEEFEKLFAKWTVAHRDHSACKKALMASTDLYLKLAAYIADLEAYGQSEVAQERVEFVMPTVQGLFQSPLYFSQEEGRVLEAFSTPNGLTVSQFLAAEFPRSPNLEDVCLAHTMAPLLKRIFGLTTYEALISGKQFREFWKQFVKLAADKIQVKNKQQKARRKSWPTAR